ncbi:GON domain-containing protein [Enhygromyxa salina]|nr:GON domain-containing protein [Enhygromyxa salina]
MDGETETSGDGDGDGDGDPGDGDGDPAETCMPDSCDVNATCDDSSGMIECTCNEGWEGDGLACGDVDECAEQIDDCAGICTNEEGGFSCTTTETCADVLAALPDATDGEYELFHKGDSALGWVAYCHDMAGTPTEYLTLTSLGPDLNFSQYTAGGGAPGTDVRTNYERLRIDPLTLEVDIDDQTFSNSVGSVMHGDLEVTSLSYAVAIGCESDVDNGLANIDLQGTPFAVTGEFCQGGFQPLGGATKSMNDQVVDLTGGGFCGWTTPTADPCPGEPQTGTTGARLQLGFAP